MLQVYPTNPKSSKKFHRIHEIQTIAANESYRRGTKRRICHWGGGLYVELFHAVFPAARSVPLHWNRNRLHREIGIRQLDRAAPSLSWLHYNTIFSSWSRGCGPRGAKVEREERHREERESERATVCEHKKNIGVRTSITRVYACVLAEV